MVHWYLTSASAVSGAAWTLDGHKHIPGLQPVGKVPGVCVFSFLQELAGSGHLSESSFLSKIQVVDSGL